MSERAWPALALCALLFGGLAAAPTARAAEDPGDRPPELKKKDRGKERDEQVDRKKAFRRIVKVYKKMREGQELNADEKALLDQFRRGRGPQHGKGDRPGVGAPRIEVRWGPGPAQQAGPPRHLRRDERLNVIDAAYYEIAEIHITKRQYNEAVTALRQLLQRSPDPFAKSLTHFNLAELYRKTLHNNDKAIDAYKQVTGELAVEALRRLAQLFEELEQIDEAVDQLQRIINTTKDKTQKVLALRELAGLLARNNREDEAVAVLQNLTRAVTYEEAKAISKALIEARDRHLKRQQEAQERARLHMMRAWQQRWQGKKPVKDQELRALRIRPREPKRKGGLEPRERPIRPEPDRD